MSGRDTNFYYSFLVLPPAKRRAIVAVWDFCRAVDDAVDEMAPCGEATRDGAACAELAKWRRELSACFGEGEPETRQGAALRPYVSVFDLPRVPLALARVSSAASMGRSMCHEAGAVPVYR